MGPGESPHKGLAQMIPLARVGPAVLLW